jgi:hypothetical protein
LLHTAGYLRAISKVSDPQGGVAARAGPNPKSPTPPPVPGAAANLPTSPIVSSTSEPHIGQIRPQQPLLLPPLVRAGLISRPQDATGCARCRRRHQARRVRGAERYR